MTTLSNFQQSELKRFDEKYLNKYPNSGEGLWFNEMLEVKKSFNSAIEKAHALGKEEKEKEIFYAKGTTHCSCVYDVRGRRVGRCLRCVDMELKANLRGREKMKKEILAGLPKKMKTPQEFTNGYNAAINEVLNLLKNK